MSAPVSAVCRSTVGICILMAASICHECCRPKLRRHSSLRVLTTVTCFCLASLTICSSVFRPYKSLQHILLLEPNNVSTSHPSLLRQFHWLPVQQHIKFKLAVLVYKALNVPSPHYLADDCQLTTTTARRQLWSSNVVLCEFPRTCTSLGDHSFTVAGPCLWNNRPLRLRDSEHTLLEFRR